MHAPTRRPNGFTLIELLVAIAINAILAATGHNLRLLARWLLLFLIWICQKIAPGVKRAAV